MGLFCKLKGHEWGEWGEWQEREETRPREYEDGIVISAKYIHDKKKKRRCERCGAYDWEKEFSESRLLDAEEYYARKDEEESIQAHFEAKDNHEYPVNIGEYVTAGVEDFSKHHRRGDEPLIRHNGFVIFVKKSPNNLELGDVITAKISSFNEGDSANAVFITRTEKSNHV